MLKSGNFTEIGLLVFTSKKKEKERKDKKRIDKVKTLYRVSDLYVGRWLNAAVV